MVASVTAGVVLAAGSSVRMGQPKQLLRFHGRPLLESVVLQVAEARIDRVVVVLGGHAEIIQDAVAWGPARVIVNHDHPLGMSTSLQRGLNSLEPEVTRAIIVLGDQAGISAVLLNRLLDAHERDGRSAAALCVNGLLQPPVVIGRELWPQAMSLRGDVGFRDWLRERPGLVTAVSIRRGREMPRDIDTPEDYRRLIAADAAQSSATPADDS